MTIAHATEAVSASYQVALPVLREHQIWELASESAATFWTGFSFQKIFRESLFSGNADYRRDIH